MTAPRPEPGSGAGVVGATARTAFRGPYSDWSAEQLLAHFQARTGVFVGAVRDAEQASDSMVDALLENRFIFNREEHTLPPGFDWKTNPSQDLEWLILLHKFYYAPALIERFQRTGDALCVTRWIDLTEAYIHSVPAGFLPNDVRGRRVQNWIYAHALLFAGPRPVVISAEFHLRFLKALAVEVDHLSRHLTPARNHRTIELSALFLAALAFPEFAGAEGWLVLAREELQRNIERDLLPDGVHCELSSDYHCLALKNYLNVREWAQAHGVGLPPAFDVALQRGLDFVLHVHRPDGEIPALSDGDSRSFLELLQRGHRLFDRPEWLYAASRGREGRAPSLRAALFPSAGYVVLRSGWGDRGEALADERFLVFDCGPLGEGNHGHLDLLSVELSAYGRPLVVDPGRFTYHEPVEETPEVEANWRVWFRRTAAHNTVQVDEKEQTRYEPGPKRWRIAGPTPGHELRAFASTDTHDYVHGIARSHEYPVVHERRIFFVRPDYWVISDQMRAEEAHDYDLRFHLDAPALGRVTIEERAGCWVVRSPCLVMVQVREPETTVTIDGGFVSKAYGVKQGAPVIRFHRRARNTLFHTVLFPFAGPEPRVDVEQIPVNCSASGPAAARPFGLRVEVEWKGQRWRDYFCAGDAEIAGDLRCGSVLLTGVPGWARQLLEVSRNDGADQSDSILS